MTLKVLLADDNITAQRMGSKILSDAGYTVVAVSNGAAAVKKIAAERPDLLILDVFMPGYSGLEVCEKIKNASETAGVPVLLTVTNMEPYSAADGNRVKADGVLIKPFEATDLLAVMHKFEEKLQAALAETQKIAALQEFEDASYVEAEAEVKPAEMPLEVAAEPAMGTEHLEETPAAEAAPTFAVEAPAAEEAAPTFGAAPIAEAAPGFALPPVAEEIPPLHALESAPPSFDSNPPTETAFEPVAEPAVEPAAEAGPAPEIAPPAELEFTSAPQVGPVEVAPAAELEITEQPDSEIAIVRDPALATSPEDFSDFTTKFGAEHAEEIPIGIAMVETHAETEALEAIPEFLDEPMEALEEPSASVPQEEMGRAAEHFDVREPVVEAGPEPEPEYDTQRIHAVVEEPDHEMWHTPAIIEELEQEVHDVRVMAHEQEQEVQPVPTMLAESEALHQIASSSEDQQPEVQQAAATVEPAERDMQPVSATVEEPEYHAEQIPVMAEEAEAAPEMEMEPPAAAAQAPASSMSEDRVADAVQRVLDRYKGELIAAIVRELKS